ncbi:hypothetical protein ACIO3O_37335 [Streptomyces sp. NPDC087440]|uniref:hypothetical protein n=1 Tax=Streptomyces sp. NPDC087440 TaxID=3365790 RepID=UPI0038082E79
MEQDQQPDLAPAAQDASATAPGASASPLNRQAFLERLSEGKSAYQAGDPSDACPYDRFGDAEEQFGYRYWTRGWKEARSERESAAAAAAGQ